MYRTDAPEHAILAFRYPAPERLAAQAFGRFRGVFLFCPVLLAGLAGWAAAARRDRATARLAAGAFVLYMLYNASLNPMYWAGITFYFGPRYLLPALPLVALGVLHLDWRSRAGRVAVGLLVLSVALNVLGAMFHDVFIATPYDDTRLQRPLSYLVALLREHGPRVPLLDAYGASRATQWAALAAAAAVAAVLTRPFWRRTRRA